MLIYVMRCGKFVKVGRAANAATRLRTLQSGNHAEISLAWTLTVRREYASDIERNAHLRLTRYAVKGEWFKCSWEVASAAVIAANAQVGFPPGDEVASESVRKRNLPPAVGIPFPANPVIKAMREKLRASRP